MLPNPLNVFSPHLSCPLGIIQGCWPRHSSWPTVSLASVTTSSCGLPPTPSLDHILFFTSPGNPAFNGSDITIICSQRAIKLSFVTMLTMNLYICLCALPTHKLRKGSKLASFSHHHMHCPG